MRKMWLMLNEKGILFLVDNVHVAKEKPEEESEDEPYKDNKLEKNVYDTE